MQDTQSLLPVYEQDQFDSRHRLVLVASQRAKQLVQGAPALLPSKFTKESTIAVHEVLHGEIKHLRGEEAREALKEAKRGKDADAERMAEIAGEDAKEIKKELSVYVDDSANPEQLIEGQE